MKGMLLIRIQEKKRRRGKYDNVIIRATPQLTEFFDTANSLVRSTENQLKKKGYI